MSGEDMSTDTESLEARLDRIEKCLRRRRRKGDEAGKGQLHQEWREAEDELDALLRKGHDNLRIRKLHALAASNREAWNLAIARWQKVLDLGDGPLPRSRQRLARAYRATGQFGAAREMLEQARTEGLKRRRYRRSRKRLNRQYSQVERLELGEEFLTALEKGEKKPAQEALIAWLEEGLPGADEGLPRSVLKELPELVAELLALDQQAREADTGSATALAMHWFRRLRGIGSRGGPRGGPRGDVGSTGEPLVILSCGFGWSGSGAVTDFLQDYQAVETLFGRAELAWFHSSHGNDAAGLFEQLRRGPAGYLAGVRDFILTHLLGLDLLARSLGEGEGERGVEGAPARLQRARTVRDRAVVWGFVDEDADFGGFVSALREFSGALRGIRPARLDAPQRIEAAFRDFLSKVVGLRRSAQAVCLLNNAIKAYRLSLVRLLPEARVIPVFRDPRDMYVSRALESPRGVLPPREYVRALRRRDRDYRRALRDPAIAERVMPVRFEDFVLEPERRTALLEQLGMDPRAPRHKTRFRPERSRGNIGIHRHWEEPEVIDRIARGLPDWLHPAAD